MQFVIFYLHRRPAVVDVLRVWIAVPSIRNPIRRVCEYHVCLLPVHQPVNGCPIGAVPAHQAMPTKLPYIAQFRDRLDNRISNRISVKIIVTHFACRWFYLKPKVCHVKVGFKVKQFSVQQFNIPVGHFCGLVVHKPERLDLFLV